MDWDDYQIFDPKVDRPLSELPRKRARAAFEHLLDNKELRIQELRRLAQANGIDLDAGGGLKQLNSWFVENVESNSEEPDRLSDRWYSVVNDIGLYLGDKVIAQSGGKLNWRFHTARKSDMSYQRHVVAGFDVENPNYHVDFDLLVGMYGHRIVRNEDVDTDYFCLLVVSALEKV